MGYRKATQGCNELRALNIHYLQESMSFELKIGDKLYNFVSFENLERDLDRLFQSNPFLIVVISDFNVKPSSWYNHGKASSEGNAVDTITRQYGLHRV